MKLIDMKDYNYKTELEKYLYNTIGATISHLYGSQYVDRLEFEHPANPELGEYSTNIALKLAKERGVSPMEIASEIDADLMKRGTEDVTAIIEYDPEPGNMEFYVDIERRKEEKVKAPGFYNIFPGKGFLISEVEKALELKENYGKTNVNSGKRYMVEFSQPNPMKAFHIGHLKGTLYGESLSRILEQTGIEVVRANYQGDVGLHIAKIMWAVIQEYPEDLPKDLEAKSLSQKVDFIQQLYVLGAKAFEENGSAKEEIYKLNEAVNNQEEHIQKYYKPFRQWSIDQFDEIYKRLDTRFDRYYYESETIKPALKHVEDAIKREILEKEENGAVVFRGEDYGLHTRVFITEKGTPTYEAKDLELGYLEATEHGNLDKQIFLVGAEQKGYLQVVFKVRELLFGDLLKDKQEHVVNGFVNVKGMKMSSRTGEIVKAEDVLNVAIEAISKVVGERDYSEEEKNRISEALGVAAVKYSILNNNPNKDAIFDLEASVSVEGQSAPYVMYAYTRAKSILSESDCVIPDLIRDLDFRLPARNVSDAGGRGNDKGEGEEGIAKVNGILKPVQSLPSTRSGDDIPLFSTDSEMAILRTLYKFSEIVQIAAENYAPNYVADYIFDLAQKFNAFYRECPVLKAEDNVKNSRLALTAAVAQVLKNGLYLLGIGVLERM